MRLWPRSMLGQVLLSVALALLVAQCIAAVLLLNAAEARRDNAMLNAVAFQLVRQDAPREPREARLRERRGPPRGDRWRNSGMRPRMPRPFRLEWTATPPASPAEARDSLREEELTALLAAQGVPVAEVVVFERALAADRFLASRPRLVDRVLRERGEDAEILVAALRREGAEQWAVARIAKVPVQRGVHRTIIFQTLVIFLLLVGLLVLLIRRIARPLAALAERTESFSGTIPSAQPLPERGPEDVRRLTRAHNAMEARIAALLDEKDVMLGAIGHDLKTPLAALRVRVESVEDEAQRERMAAGIEDITRTLDDILSLARVGRAGEPPEKTNLAALAAAVVEEFEDMDQPVSLGEAPRVVCPVHVTWLRRALRNLISNAVRYGGVARVSLATEGGAAILRVEDDGPGIAENRIADMLEPFARGEASRNRATGGAGLGLTLARAIAEQHGGTLVLANRDEGGLRAEIRLADAADVSDRRRRRE